MRYPHGSNGDVHRGPDKFLRRNTIRVMFLGALADAGLSLEDLRSKRKHRKGATLVPLAMLDHCKQAFKNIAVAAAQGDPKAFGPFLRMMSDAHVMLQPAKDEVGQDRTPRPAKFAYSSETEPPAPASDPPGRPPAPGTLLDANGQEYVEA